MPRSDDDVRRPRATATGSTGTTTALQAVCSQCRSRMAEHFSGLLQILEQIDQFNLKPEAANGLIKGVVMIISIMSQEQLCGAVEKVCMLQVTPLNKCMDSASSATPPKIVKHSTTDPVLYLDRLSAVFRHVQPSNGCPPGATAHPCKSVVEGIWPVLSRSLHLGIYAYHRLGRHPRRLRTCSNCRARTTRGPCRTG